MNNQAPDLFLLCSLQTSDSYSLVLHTAKSKTPVPPYWHTELADIQIAPNSTSTWMAREWHKLMVLAVSLNGSTAMQHSDCSLSRKGWLRSQWCGRKCWEPEERTSAESAMAESWCSQAGCLKMPHWQWWSETETEAKWAWRKRGKQRGT